MGGAALLDVLFPWRELRRLRAAERQWQEAERRRQRSFDEAGIGTWRRTAEGQAEWSPHLKQMFGFPPDAEPSYADYLKVVHPDSRELVDRTTRESMKAGENFKCVYQIVRADGSTRWIEGHGRWIRDDAGLPLYLEGIATDVTARMQLEVELADYRRDLETLVAERTRKLRSAMERNHRLASRLEMACLSARLGTWVRDLVGESSFWDDSMYEIFGQFRSGGESAPSNEKWLQWVHPDDRERMRSATWSLPEESRPKDLCFRVLTAQGQLRYLRSTALADFAGTGRAVQLMGTCEDITQEWEVTVELRQAKERAEAATALKTRFLAASSHELRQPLAAAALILDLMAQTARTGPIASLVGRLGHSLDDLNRRLDSLLYDGRASVPGIQKDDRLLRVDGLRAWLDEEFMERFHVAGLRFALHFPREAIGIRTDEPRLKAILRNLLVNALKFCSRGGVLVSCRRRQSGLLFQVWDTGIGIDEANLPRIFDEFFRIRDLSRESTWGQGLGLAICRHEAQLLGASLDCRSRKGRGSVFSLRLPAEHVVDLDSFQPAEASRDLRRDAPALVAGRHVCLIEDSPPVRDSLSLLLGSWGMDVAAFEDAATALSSPDLVMTDFVVTDYRLPGSMDGLALLQEIEQRRGSPVRGVVLTGEADIAPLAEQSAKRWPILRKPFNAGTLALALDQAGGG